MKILNETRITKVYNKRPKSVDSLLITKPSNVQYLVASMHPISGAVLMLDEAAYLLTSEYYTPPLSHPVSVISSGTHELVDITAGLLKQHRAISLGAELETMTYEVATKLEKQLDQTLKDVSGLTEQLRMVKEEYEIQRIKNAVSIAEGSLEEIIHALRPGARESEIALMLEIAMLRNGSSGVPFETIVVSGPRSSMPHGRPTDRVVELGELVTIDFGATYKGYCCDITRTFSVGHPTDEMKYIYNLVFRAQQAALRVIHAGIEARDIDRAARQLIAAEGFGPFFGHGGGHGVGIEVHERPGLRHYVGPVPRNTVLAVEPGVYLPGRFGVRIEDMLVVTNSGITRLTTSTSDLRIL